MIMMYIKDPKNDYQRALNEALKKLSQDSRWQNLMAEGMLSAAFYGEPRIPDSKIRELAEEILGEKESVDLLNYWSGNG